MYLVYVVKCSTFLLNLDWPWKLGWQAELEVAGWRPGWGCQECWGGVNIVYTCYSLRRVSRFRCTLENSQMGKLSTVLLCGVTYSHSCFASLTLKQSIIYWTRLLKCNSIDIDLNKSRITQRPRFETVTSNLFRLFTNNLIKSMLKARPFQSTCLKVWLIFIPSLVQVSLVALPGKALVVVPKNVVLKLFFFSFYIHRSCCAQDWH